MPVVVVVDVDCVFFFIVTRALPGVGLGDGVAVGEGVGVAVGDGVGVGVTVGVGVGEGAPLTHEYKSLFGDVVSLVVNTPFVAEFIMADATDAELAVGWASR